jgi:hypothetical protein
MIEMTNVRAQLLQQDFKEMPFSVNTGNFVKDLLESSTSKR